jgi:hypothetical protein
MRKCILPKMCVNTNRILTSFWQAWPTKIAWLRRRSPNQGAGSHLGLRNRGNSFWLKRVTPIVTSFMHRLSGVDRTLLDKRNRQRAHKLQHFCLFGGPLDSADASASNTRIIKRASRTSSDVPGIYWMGFAG